MSWLSDRTGVDLNVGSGTARVNGPGSKKDAQLAGLIAGALTGNPAIALAGMGVGGALFGGSGQDGGYNLSGLQGQWNQLGKGITGEQQQKLLSQAAGMQAGQEAKARSGLAMRGGATSGSTERLARAGAWDRLNAASDIALNQSNKALEHAQKGFTDVTIPVLQGKDMARASQNAADSSLMGSVISGGLGFLANMPAKTTPSSGSLAAPVLSKMTPGMGSAIGGMQPGMGAGVKKPGLAGMMGVIGGAKPMVQAPRTATSVHIGPKPINPMVNITKNMGKMPKLGF